MDLSSFPPLNIADVIPGVGIIRILNSVLGKFDDKELIGICNELDALKRSLIVFRNYKPEDGKKFGKYFGIMSSLLDCVDIGQLPSSFQFECNGAKSSKVNFELCCLGYNVILGLMKTAASHTHFVKTALTEINECILIANTILCTIRPLIDTAIENLLSKNNIESISRILYASFIHFQVIVFSLSGQPDFKKAEICELAALMYSQTSPPFQDFSGYFKLLSYGYLAKGLANESLIGQAIRVLKTISETNTNFAPSSNLKAFFSGPQAKIENDNKNIYMSPIPPLSAIRKVVACSRPEIKSLPIFETGGKIPSLIDSIKNHIMGFVDANRKLTEEKVLEINKEGNSVLAQCPKCFDSKLNEVIRGYLASQDIAFRMVAEFKQSKALLASQYQSQADEAIRNIEKFIINFAKMKQNAEFEAARIDSIDVRLHEIWQRMSTQLNLISQLQRDFDQVCNRITTVINSNISISEVFNMFMLAKSDNNKIFNEIRKIEVDINNLSTNVNKIYNESGINSQKKDEIIGLFNSITEQYNIVTIQINLYKEQIIGLK